METKSINQQWIVSEVELNYVRREPTRVKISSSRNAHKVFEQVWADGKMDLLEQFWVLFTNRANEVLACSLLTSGGITGTVVDLRILFATALKLNAVGIVIAHNHPSGQLLPSSQDISITKKIKSAGEMLDIPLLDHMIMTSEGYYSFADNGHL